MLIAQISDLHVGGERVAAYYKLDTRLALRRAVDCINALAVRPDTCLVTGDIVESGLADEYRLARAELERLTMPWHPIPGNHDDRGAFLDAFQDCLSGRDARLDGFAQYAIDDYPLRILALDTLVPGQNHGDLSDGRMTWLETQLRQYGDTPTLLMMHHPPFATGMPVIDGMILADRQAFAQLISLHPQVEAIVSGHIHRIIHGRVAHALASIAPSTAHQVALALRAEDPIAFNHEPAGFHLHAWHSPGTWTSMAVPTGSYAGPFAFS